MKCHKVFFRGSSLHHASIGSDIQCPSFIRVKPHEDLPTCPSHMSWDFVKKRVGKSLSPLEREGGPDMCS